MAEMVRLRGISRGYRRGNTFELTNGQIWEQTSHRYVYSYHYRPEAELERSGARGLFRIDGLNDWIDVKRVR
jgi:hypothetical protein